MERQGKVTGDPKIKGENFYRTAKKVKTLNMFKDGKAIRNSDGKILQAASYQSRDVPKAVVEPNRRWFTNTRVISQDTLTSFREAIAEKDKDPYSVLLKSNKLPMSLIRDGPSLQDGLKKHQAKMTIESEPFSETFGPKAQRKRPKLSFNTVDELAGHTEQSFDSYQARLEEIKLLSGTAGAVTDSDALVEEDFSVATAKEAIFSKGQSKRIWNELCESQWMSLLPTPTNNPLDKVMDSSDVILHVIDARDPLGTRWYVGHVSFLPPPCANSFHSRHVEKYLAAEAPHKHLVFVLNKIDLVPSSTAVSSVRIRALPSPLSPPCPLVRPTAWPQGFSQDPSAFSCSMGEFRYDPGRVISISNVPDLVFRLGIGGRRFGVLPPDTGRVSYELKAATVHFGQAHGCLLSDDSHISNTCYHPVMLPPTDANREVGCVDPSTPERPPDLRHAVESQEPLRARFFDRSSPAVQHPPQGPETDQRRPDRLPERRQVEYHQRPPRQGRHKGCTHPR